MKTIAKDAGVNVFQDTLFADNLGEDNSRGIYQTMLIVNTETIVKGLVETYIAFASTGAASQ